MQKPLNSANVATCESRLLHCQTRQRNFTICYVVVDPFSKQILSGLIFLHRLDRSIFHQLGDDIVALSVCVRICGMGNLKCQSSERQAGVSCAGPDPKNALNLRWPVGVQPETRGSPCILGTRQAQRPKSYVMALPRTVIDSLLKTDVLAAPEEIERAERGGGIWRVEYEGSNHAPRACQTQSIGF